MQKKDYLLKQKNKKQRTRMNKMGASFLYPLMCRKKDHLD